MTRHSDTPEPSRPLPHTQPVGRSSSSSLLHPPSPSKPPSPRDPSAPQLYASACDFAQARLLSSLKFNTWMRSSAARDAQLRARLLQAYRHPNAQNPNATAFLTSFRALEGAYTPRGLGPKKSLANAHETRLPENPHPTPPISLPRLLDPNPKP